MMGIGELSFQAMVILNLQPLLLPVTQTSTIWVLNLELIGLDFSVSYL
jgi:hypothetical protein